ncbi:hypothetical protein K505DRAFT_328597 [Melanomma pulvis-pyrius CBS 109.77]|uniref:Uncharacterized protein n=1 Tax=Melanomma pulvis-pyrius CBS 109.77 TaxID=1314802 RepID=A0A6A6WXT1_9PLEO|nr:hypothetical protein K505DRAFT_328597 [Melanomma pulvis-pyrius CBS 109.77]
MAPPWMMRFPERLSLGLPPLFHPSQPWGRHFITTANSRNGLIYSNRNRHLNGWLEEALRARSATHVQCRRPPAQHHGYPIIWYANTLRRLHIFF